MYSAIAGPSYFSLKKNVPYVWSKTCDDSFQQLKDSEVNSSALSFPR